MFYRNLVSDQFDAHKILNGVEVQHKPLSGLFDFYFAFSLFSNFQPCDVDDHFLAATL